MRDNDGDDDLSFGMEGDDQEIDDDLSIDEDDNGNNANEEKKETDNSSKHNAAMPEAVDMLVKKRTSSITSNYCYISNHTISYDRNRKQ